MNPEDIQKEKLRLQAWLAEQLQVNADAKKQHADHFTKQEAEYLAAIERMKAHRDQMTALHDQAIKDAQAHIVSEFKKMDDAQKKR